MEVVDHRLLIPVAEELAPWNVQLGCQRLLLDLGEIQGLHVDGVPLVAQAGSFGAVHVSYVQGLLDVLYEWELGVGRVEDAPGPLAELGELGTSTPELGRWRHTSLLQALSFPNLYDVWAKLAELRQLLELVWSGDSRCWEVLVESDLLTWFQGLTRRLGHLALEGLELFIVVILQICDDRVSVGLHELVISFGVDRRAKLAASQLTQIRVPEDAFSDQNFFFEQVLVFDEVLLDALPDGDLSLEALLFSGELFLLFL